MSKNSAQTKLINQPVVVVAGGAGFLGSHVSEALLRSGARVLAVDTMEMGKREHIESFRHHPKYQFFEFDINEGMPKAFADLPISHVLYAAVETYASREEFHLGSLLNNSLGVKNLLDLAVAKQARVVLGSSIHIYDGLASSMSLNHYFGARSEEEIYYSQLEAKRYAEMLGETYARIYNLDVRVARLSEVYGPRMELSGETILKRLLTEVLKGEDLRVEVEGSKEVLLTYVSDVVFGLMQLLFAEEEACGKSIYQFAHPEKVSVLSIAYTLREYLPTKHEVVFLPPYAYQEFALPQLSLERTQRDLAWEPLIDLTEGLRRTVGWFKKGQQERSETAVDAGINEANKNKDGESATVQAEKKK